MISRTSRSVQKILDDAESDPIAQRWPPRDRTPTSNPQPHDDLTCGLPSPCSFCQARLDAREDADAEELELTQNITLELQPAVESLAEALAKIILRRGHK